MKILFIRTNSILPDSSVLKETNVTGVYPVLGLGYLAAVARKAGHEVSFFDVNAEKPSLESFDARIIESAAEIVCFSATTLIWPNVLIEAKRVKQLLPGALIIVGGPQLSVYPLECLTFDFIDVGVFGEGEETLLEIAGRFKSGQPLDDIDGTVVRKNGRPVMNKPRPPIRDLDSIPFPAVDLYPLSKYRALTIEKPFFTMVSSRGCPYLCNFCTQIYGGGIFRQRSAANVLDEMTLYKEKYGAREIIMFDETFILNIKRVREICQGIIDRKLNIRWNIRTRIDTLDRETLELLKKAGCYGLHIGIESGDDRILGEMNKKINLSEVKKGIAMANEIGFETRGYFMIGYPSETLETIKRTIRFAKELDLTWASFTVTIPLPATKLIDQALKLGIIKEDIWRKYALGAPVDTVPYFITPEYDRDKLNALRKKAYMEFYLRPGYIFKKLLSPRIFRYLFQIIKEPEI